MGACHHRTPSSTLFSALLRICLLSAVFVLPTEFRTLLLEEFFFLVFPRDHSIDIDFGIWIRRYLSSLLLNLFAVSPTIVIAVLSINSIRICNFSVNPLSRMPTTILSLIKSSFSCPYSQCSASACSAVVNSSAVSPSC